MSKFLSAALVIVFAVSAARAERPPQSREQAKLAVTGTVKKITTAIEPFGKTGEMTKYTAEVVVESVDAGAGAKVGDTVTVTWFHVTKRPAPGEMIVGAFGHAYGLKEKDRAKIWLVPGVKEKGTWAIIYNKNGAEKIEATK